MYVNLFVFSGNTPAYFKIEAGEFIFFLDRLVGESFTIKIRI